MKELVVNWHVTEACNFKCRYCFAHWDRDCKKDLFQNTELVSQLLTELAHLLSIFNGEFKHLRLNLVGGETFLYKKQIRYVIREAQIKGMKLSAVTNGSQLDDEFIQIISECFDTIGLSVDFMNDKTNLLIGREEKNRAMDIEKLIQQVKLLKRLKPDLKVKINTVVNKLNYQEFLGDFIDRINPDKWKVFQMLPMTKQSRLLEIDKFEFKLFIENHKKYKEILYEESNTKMRESYLMIDPLGRFFQNNKIEQGYTYSKPIHEVGIEQAFSEISFDKNKFLSRYKRVEV